MKLGIFSGECLIGICGDKTELFDYQQKELYIGDIVLVSYVERNLGTHSSYLSVIVNDKYTTFTNDVIEENKIFQNFVMGIAKVTEKDLSREDDEGELTEGWLIEKLKDHSDVIDGEHWKNYGFNYKKLDDITFSSIK
jgi:hypothetical protein